MTQTTQGTGPGSAERYSKGPDGGNRTSVSAGPYVVAAGHCVTTGNEGYGNWQVRVTFPEALRLNPHDYVVMTAQDDYDNNDGRNQYPPHIEKLDAEGNNENDGYTGGFGGFIIHTGDSDERRAQIHVDGNQDRLQEGLTSCRKNTGNRAGKPALFFYASYSSRGTTSTESSSPLHL